MYDNYQTRPSTVDIDMVLTQQRFVCEGIATCKNKKKAFFTAFGDNLARNIFFFIFFAVGLLTTVGCIVSGAFFLKMLFVLLVTVPFMFVGLYFPLSSTIRGMSDKSFLLTENGLYIYTKNRERAKAYYFEDIESITISQSKQSQNSAYDYDKEYEIKIFHEIPGSSVRVNGEYRGRMVEKIRLGNSPNILTVYEYISKKISERQKANSPENLYDKSFDYILNKNNQPVNAPNQNPVYNNANQNPYGNTGYNNPNQSSYGNNGYNNANQSPYGNTGYNNANQNPYGNTGYNNANQNPYGNNGYNNANQNPYRNEYNNVNPRQLEENNARVEYPLPKNEVDESFDYILRKKYEDKNN